MKQIKGNVRTYSNYYVISSDYFEQRQNQVDLTRILYDVLKTSSNHDNEIKSLLTSYVISKEDVWVITQAHWEIVAWPKLGEEVQIQTMVTHSSKYLIQRYFAIKTIDGEKLIDIWIQFAAINYHTRQISLIDKTPLKMLDLINKENYYRFTRLQLPDKVDKINQVHYPISKNDIDGNQHVNNRVYLKWCLNVFDPKFMYHHDIAKVDIKYGQELRFEDEIELETHWIQRETNEGLKTFQIIKNMTKGTIACEVMIEWY